MIDKVLRPLEMPDVTTEKFEKIEKGFRHRWDYPNCIGAIDGKHVVIQSPPNSGSDWFNYKGQFSLQLLAIVDHTYRFSYVDVGNLGSNADCSVFRNSTVGESLLNGTLGIPAPKALPGTQVVLPHVIVADEAFPLHQNIMRPYPRVRNVRIPWENTVYNYRHSRARRIVENAFGILSQRWRIFTRRICLDVDNAKKIVMASCLLHNFLQEDKSYEATMADLCQGADPVPNVAMQPFPRLRGYRGADDALEIRSEFRHYFNTAGKLPWQDEFIRQKQGLN